MHTVSVVRSLLLGSLLFSIGTESGLRAADWPQWRGSQRTGHAASDEKPLTALPEAPRTVWKVPAAEGYASPVVSEGRVFVMEAADGKEVLRALDAADGREQWRAVIDETFKDSQGPAAPRCTAGVADGRVYAQSCRGELVCLSVKDGKRLWSVNYTRDFGAVFIGEKGSAPGATRHGNNGAPRIEGGVVWASAGSTNGAGVVALDAAAGTVQWKGGNEVAAYAAPVVTTIGGVRQVVNFMADAVVGLDAGNGKVLWRHPMKTDFARHVMTPIVHGNRVVVGSHQTGLLGLDIESHGGQWRVGEAWTNREAGPNFSSPVLVDGHVYGLGADRDVVCVDVANGATRWKKSGWMSSAADKAHAGFVVVGGKSILMLTDGGELILFAAESAACRELGRVQVCGANWCNPAYVGRRLYLRDGLKAGGSWWCVELAGKGG